MMELNIETIYAWMYVIGVIIGIFTTGIAWWQKNKYKIRKMLEQGKNNVTVKLYRKYQKMYKDWKGIFVKEFDEALIYIMTQKDYEEKTHSMIKEVVATVKKYKKPTDGQEKLKEGQK